MGLADVSVLEQYALQREKRPLVRIWDALADFVRHKPLGAFGGAIVILLLIVASIVLLLASPLLQPL